MISPSTSEKWSMALLKVNKHSTVNKTVWLCAFNIMSVRNHPSTCFDTYIYLWGAIYQILGFAPNPIWCMFITTSDCIQVNDWVSLFHMLNIKSTQQMPIHPSHHPNELHKWAGSWQNQQNGMCTQQRLRSAWATVQSDKNLRCPHEESFGP